MLRTATVTILEQGQIVTVRQRRYAVTDVQANSFPPAPLSRQDGAPQHDEYVIIQVMDNCGIWRTCGKSRKSYAHPNHPATSVIQLGEKHDRFHC